MDAIIKEKKIGVKRRLNLKCHSGFSGWTRKLRIRFWVFHSRGGGEEGGGRDGDPPHRTRL